MLLGKFALAKLSYTLILLSSLTCVSPQWNPSGGSPNHFTFHRRKSKGKEQSNQFSQYNGVPGFNYGGFPSGPPPPGGYPMPPGAPPVPPPIGGPGYPPPPFAPPMYANSGSFFPPTPPPLVFRTSPTPDPRTPPPNIYAMAGPAAFNPFFQPPPPSTTTTTTTTRRPRTTRRTRTRRPAVRIPVDLSADGNEVYGYFVLLSRPNRTVQAVPRSTPVPTIPPPTTTPAPQYTCALPSTTPAPFIPPPPPTPEPGFFSNYLPNAWFGWVPNPEAAANLMSTPSTTPPPPPEPPTFPTPPPPTTPRPGSWYYFGLPWWGFSFFP